MSRVGERVWGDVIQVTCGWGSELTGPFVGLVKDFAFYSERNVKPSKDLWQEPNSGLSFLKAEV